MTKTRRQSKRQEAAASAEPAAESISASASAPSISASQSIVVPDDVDIEFLSNLLPDVNFESPSPDAIVSLYRVLLSQSTDIDATQREVEELKAEVEKREVELDQALQDKETATKDLEASLETTQNELKQVKQEKDELAASRNELQAKLASLTTSQSASSTEVDTLRHRVEDVEREKRDLMGVVSRLKEDSSQRDEEIHTLRTNLKQARQEYQTLESQVRELRSTETSNKFKLESSTQQLQLARDEVERLTTDLTTKTEEFANYRRQKHAELAQLHASHDSLAQTHAATESTLKALQSSHSSQSHQLAQAQARVQELKGQLAEQEATYSSEAAGLRRLVQMMEEREAQAKSIVENIEKEWADVGDRAERREVVLREEIDSERQRADAAEKKVNDLQQILNRMDRGEFPVPSFATGGSVSTPGTPIHMPTTPMHNGTPGNDILSAGMMGLSPTVAIASRVQRSGKTFTEVYADYVKLQEEYAKKSQEYENMDRTLNSVLAEIEKRAPLINQQREEYERVQGEAEHLVEQLRQAIESRDALEKSARENEQKFVKSSRENEILNKQLNDLGRQVQALLRELGRVQDPSIPADDILEQMTGPAEDIEAVITNNLVLFRSLPQLQEQNQKLLKIVRDLGDKLEGEEREYREILDKEQSEAIQEAHDAIKLLQEQLENQKKAADITIQARQKEAEALKALLQKERTSRIVNGINGQESTSTTSASEELSEIQNHFEAYKTEMGVDSVHLREEILNAQREAGTLGANLAKASAKIEYLNERNRTLQEEVTVQNKDIQALTKRNQDLSDRYTRIDIECNRVSEDLHIARNAADQLRNECANLKAEKRIWESVQSRLVDENKNLAVERSQLSDLMANVQRMHGDLERSGENDRRRLESQIQMLETQTQDLRSQLTQERDAVRHLTLQKDLELKELRTRIDKSTSELSQTRESLVRAETSKKHLEERVDQLSRQLQGNEEKLSVYERRGHNGDVAPQSNPDLSREQQLEAEVAELRSALKVAEVDLSNARNHVQQFQEISQANEAALASLNQTYDDYKSTTESQLTLRESEFAALEQKLASAQQELVQLQEKNTELQRTFETERTAWINDKKVLEGTIFDLSTSERSTEVDKASREEAIRHQEERAKAAEERYSREIVAHAESIKLVEDLKTRLSNLQATARDNMAAAETAQAKLATSETSWKSQKEALDKEITDLKTRSKDLAAQNTLLHQHLESVTSQAAKIRQAADTDASASGDMDTSDDTDGKLAELRSVVSYLRKEKEIVELQLELGKQENTRLKTQIEHLSHTLEETQKVLSEEREKAVEAAASEAQHAELIERIQQLNILRESNVTLRTDCENYAKRARELEAKLQQASAELDPVKQELRVSKAELEARDQQVKRLEDESRRWQERNAQLLGKYDRIDPTEVQDLKDQVEKLTKEKEAWATNHNNLKEIIKTNNSKARAKATRMESEREALEQSMKKLEENIASLTTERDALKAEAGGAAIRQSREAELNKELETLRVKYATLEKTLAAERESKANVASTTEEQAKIAQLTEERDKLLIEKASWTATVGPSDSSEAQRQWEAEKVELVKARDNAVAAVAAAEQKLQDLETLRKNNADLQAKLQSLTKARGADRQRALEDKKAAIGEAIEKTKQELQASTVTAAVPEDLTKKHAEELHALEVKLTKEHQGELAKALEAAKQQSQATPASADSQQAAIDAAIAACEEQWNAKLAVEIAQAIDRGRTEASLKSRMKDSQLLASQNRLKALEAQVLEWKEKGLVPKDPPKITPAAATTSTTTSPVTTVPSQPTQAKPAATKPTLAAKPAAAATTAAAASTAGPSNLPKKPTTATGGPRGRGGAVRGAGRGTGRGNAPGGLSIRGQAQAADASTGAQAGESTAGGMSIMGASKRTREEGETAENSLAKRLKPTEAGNRPAPPVPFLRNRVAPPP